MQIRVGLVVPVLKNFQGAIEALASVNSFFPVVPYVIPNHKLGLSVAESWNYGSNMAFTNHCSHALIINDDILFSPYTIDNLLYAISGKQVNSDDRETVMVTGRNVRGSMSPHDLLIYKAKGGALEGASESPDFSCFLIKKDFFDKVGYFDENFKPAYFEDNDAHRRINLLGFKALNVNAPFYHFGSVTQNWQGVPAVPGEQFDANRQYYINKWGGAPGQERFDTPYNSTSFTPKEWIGQKFLQS
jgi:GT2 family glycosyltransferase